jgi:hypothetical protein
MQSGRSLEGYGSQKGPFANNDDDDDDDDDNDLNA